MDKSTKIAAAVAIVVMIYAGSQLNKPTPDPNALLTGSTVAPQTETAAQKASDATDAQSAKDLQAAEAASQKANVAAAVAEATPPVIYSTPSTTASATPDPAPTPAPSTTNDVTMSEFNAIHNGMTYDQVTTILDNPGVMGSELGTPGTTNYTVAYTYTGIGSIGANALTLPRGRM